MLSPDGRLLALAGSEVSTGGERRARIDLFDPDSGVVVRSLRGGLASAGTRSPSAPTAAGSPRAMDSPPVSWSTTSRPGSRSGTSPRAPRRRRSTSTGIVARWRRLAFSADGRRLATLALRDGRTECEVKLWDLASGRDLVTWPVSGGRPMGLAFDPDGRRLRVLLSGYQTLDARVVLFDATPLAPEVDAIELVDRLAGKSQLNSELAAKVEAEPGVDPAVRAAALEVISRRPEDCAALMERARSWLGVAAAERTPELMRRALAYAERAAALVADSNAADLATLGEARYRNGQLAECLAPLRQCLAFREHDQAVLSEERFLRALAFVAMAEAKLDHHALAQAALDEYRARRAHESAGSAARPPDDPLLAEAEALLREAPAVPRPPTSPQ